MLGNPVFGSRTWMCTIAAPALAASIAEEAICSGVTGTAGFLPGVSAEPVTAQEIITLRCTAFLQNGLLLRSLQRSAETGYGWRRARGNRILLLIVRCAKPHRFLDENLGDSAGRGASLRRRARVPSEAGRGSRMSELLQDYLPLVVFIAVAIAIGL